MKLAIVTEFYYPHLGGITEHVHNLAKFSARKGHDVTVITSNIGDNVGLKDSNYKIIRLGRSSVIYSNGSFARFNMSFNTPRIVQEIFSRERFDLVSIHNPITPTLPYASLMYADTATVGTMHTNFKSNVFATLCKPLLRKVFKQLDGTITVSQCSAKVLRRYVDFIPKVIPNGVNTECFNPNVAKIARFDDEIKNIFFIGRFDPRSGLDKIIKIFPEIKRRYHNVRLIIAGNGPLKNYYRSLAKHYDCASDVHFVGYIRDERPEYYATADIVVVPFQISSFSITLLEAMAMGRPIVASDIEGHDELMDHEEEGLMFPFHDNNAFRDSIVTLLDNEEQAKKYGMKAYQRAQRYSWDSVTDEILAYYNEVLH